MTWVNFFRWRFCILYNNYSNLSNPDYSRKAEDILWRKCFYDVILLMRKNLKYIRPNSGLEASVRTHLTAANGIFQGLLLKLQTQLDIVKIGGNARGRRV